jgi:hypothetical protein
MLISEYDNNMIFYVEDPRKGEYACQEINEPNEEIKYYPLKIVKVITKSDDPFIFSQLDKTDILIDGEFAYDADTSAHFITDDDEYFIWFKDVDYMAEPAEEEIATLLKDFLMESIDAGKLDNKVYSLFKVDQDVFEAMNSYKMPINAYFSKLEYCHTWERVIGIINEIL